MRFEVEQPVEHTALSGAMANTLGDLIDSIAALDRMEASLAAHKAELIEQARRWSEVVEQAVGGSDGAWNAEVRARRVLASELACALRIPERSAETLVAESSLLAQLPETHQALSEGAISWRHARSIIDHATSLPVPSDLRTWVRVRDGTCRFPTCSRAARICEIDHTTDWQHLGPTAHDNLAHLCPAHHRLKHQTGWKVSQLPGGVLQWRSPTGRTYKSEPDTRMSQAPVDAQIPATR